MQSANDAASYINPAQFTYSINEFNWIIRNEDNGIIHLEDHNNVATILYQQWLALGNTPTRIGQIFTYSRDKYGNIIRNDGILVSEDQPNSLSYRLYQQWIESGNIPIPPLENPFDPFIEAFNSIDPAKYSYIYTPDNILQRSDGVFIPENDPNHIGYRLYQKWLDLGNEAPPLNDLADLPPLSTIYKSPYSPHAPTYGIPPEIPELPPEEPPPDLYMEAIDALRAEIEDLKKRIP